MCLEVAAIFSLPKSGKLHRRTSRIIESAKVAPPILAKPCPNLRCSADGRVIKSLYPQLEKTTEELRQKLETGVYLLVD
jgi:hypothetical protein